MKKFIFITDNICVVGGMQSYVAGKASFLKENGWNVSVFFAAENSGTCANPSLQPYIGGGIRLLGLPPYFYSKSLRNSVLKKMTEVIGYTDKSDEIIIESHVDWASQWGELLAATIGAKHVCAICNEEFRGTGKYYDKNLDFYDFKHKRHELWGISDDTLKRLFGEYKVVPLGESYTFYAAPSDPVQNIEDKRTEKIGHEGWNLCYIGRISKDYVANILDGVRVFAMNHADITIQMIFVGNTQCREKLITEKLGNLSNVRIIRMGDMVPIPRSLFSKLDVVMAGSGSAICAAYEGIPTILADAGNNLANGLLGYDTEDFLYHKNNQVQTTYDIVLEKVLVNKEYEGRKFTMPDKVNPTCYYKKQVDALSYADNEFKYYDETKLCRPNGSRIAAIKLILISRLPWILKLFEM